LGSGGETKDQPCKWVKSGCPLFLNMVFWMPCLLSSSYTSVLVLISGDIAKKFSNLFLR